MDGDHELKKMLKSKHPYGGERSWALWMGAKGYSPAAEIIKANQPGYGCPRTRKERL